MDESSLLQPLGDNVPRLPKNLDDIDTDELIKEAVVNTSRISDPCAIAHTDITFDEFTTDVCNNERRDFFTLEGRKGQRTVTEVYEHTIEENDAIIEEINAVCTELINQQVISHYPEIEDKVREINFDNVLEPGRVINLKDHLEGCYQIKDPRFNLYPSRLCFLEPYKKACGGEKSQLYINLKDLLEQECVNAEGCQYRAYYPETRQSGRAMLPEMIEETFTCTLAAGCLSQHEQTNILTQIHEVYFGDIDEMASSTKSAKSQRVYKVKNQCIVCTMLRLTKELVKNAGIDRPCKELYEGDDENLFLLKIGDRPPSGMINVDRPDYNDCVANIYPQIKSFVHNRLELFKEYKMFVEDGIWMPMRVDKQERLVPDLFNDLRLDDHDENNAETIKRKRKRAEACDEGVKHPKIV